MPTAKEEYSSLRQELMEHQNRRLPIISTTMAIVTILFGAGIQLHNPYIPLLSLLILHSARVQLVQAHYGVQRIAAYIRVMFEEGNPELNWETGSYRIRLESWHKSRKKNQKSISIWNISPFSPLDSLIFLTSILAIAIAYFSSLSLPSSDVFGRAVTAIAAIFWLVFWVYYSWKIQDINTLAVDRREENFWREFKTIAKQKQEQEHEKA